MSIDWVKEKSGWSWKFIDCGLSETGDGDTKIGASAHTIVVGVRQLNYSFKLCQTNNHFEAKI